MSFLLTLGLPKEYLGRDCGCGANNDHDEEKDSDISSPVPQGPNSNRHDH